MGRVVLLDPARRPFWRDTWGALREKGTLAKAVRSAESTMLVIKGETDVSAG